MKKVLLLLIACLFVFAFGCNAGLDRTSTLVVATPTDPMDISPLGTDTAAYQRIVPLFYETLLEKTAVGAKGLLAVEFGWQGNEHYRLKIRKGVLFHNGEELTAEDVLFSLKLQASHVQHKGMLESFDLDASVVEDKYTLNIKMKAPQAMVEYVLMSTLVVPKAEYESNPDGFAQNPIGTGPYALVSRVMGDSLTLKAHDKYWGEQPKIENILVRIIPEAAQRVIELESGGVDCAFDLPSRDIQRLGETEGFVCQTSPSYLMMNLFMNNSQHSPLNNLALRQAIAYAIDTEALTENVYGVLATPATTFLSAYYEHYNKDYEGQTLYPQNIEKAKALMAEAGYENGLELVCFIDENAERGAAAEIIQAQLKEIGITVKFESYENVVRLNVIKNPESGWDMTVSYIGNTNVLNIIDYYLNADGVSVCGYDSERFQAVYEEMALCRVNERFVELAYLAQEIFNNDIPYYPLSDNLVSVAYADKLHDFEWFGRNTSRFNTCFFGE